MLDVWATLSAASALARAWRWKRLPRFFSHWVACSRRRRAARSMGVRQDNTRSYVELRCLMLSWRRCSGLQRLQRKSMFLHAAVWALITWQHAMGCICEAREKCKELGQHHFSVIVSSLFRRWRGAAVKSRRILGSSHSVRTMRSGSFLQKWAVLAAAIGLRKSREARVTNRAFSGWRKLSDQFQLGRSRCHDILVRQCHRHALCIIQAWVVEAQRGKQDRSLEDAALGYDFVMSTRRIVVYWQIVSSQQRRRRTQIQAARVRKANSRKCASIVKWQLFNDSRRREYRREQSMCEERLKAKQKWAIQSWHVDAVRRLARARRSIDGQCACRRRRYQFVLDLWHERAAGLRRHRQHKRSANIFRVSTLVSICMRAWRNVVGQLLSRREHVEHRQHLMTVDCVRRCLRTWRDTAGALRHKEHSLEISTSLRRRARCRWILGSWRAEAAAGARSLQHSIVEVTAHQQMATRRSALVFWRNKCRKEKASASIRKSKRSVRLASGFMALLANRGEGRAQQLRARRLKSHSSCILRSWWTFAHSKHRHRNLKTAAQAHTVASRRKATLHSLFSMLRRSRRMRLLVREARASQTSRITRRSFKKWFAYVATSRQVKLRMTLKNTAMSRSILLEWHCFSAEERLKQASTATRWTQNMAVASWRGFAVARRRERRVRKTRQDQHKRVVFQRGLQSWRKQTELRKHNRQQCSFVEVKAQRLMCTTLVMAFRTWRVRVCCLLSVRTFGCKIKQRTVALWFFAWADLKRMHQQIYRLARGRYSLTQRNALLRWQTRSKSWGKVRHALSKAARLRVHTLPQMFLHAWLVVSSQAAQSLRQQHIELRKRRSVMWRRGSLVHWQSIASARFELRTIQSIIQRQALKRRMGAAQDYVQRWRTYVGRRCGTRTRLSIAVQHITARSLRRVMELWHLNLTTMKKQRCCCHDMCQRHDVAKIHLCVRAWRTYAACRLQKGLLAKASDAHSTRRILSRMLLVWRAASTKRRALETFIGTSSASRVRRLVGDCFEAWEHHTASRVRRKSLVQMAVASRRSNKQERALLHWCGVVKQGRVANQAQRQKWERATRDSLHLWLTRAARSRRLQHIMLAVMQRWGAPRIRSAVSQWHSYAEHRRSQPVQRARLDARMTTLLPVQAREPLPVIMELPCDD